MVMPRGYGHYSGAELPGHSFIFYDRTCNFAVEPFYFESITMLILFVALIFGMHDDIFVTELGFRPGCGYLERSILQCVKRADLLLVNDFIIRNRRFQFGVPVNYAVAPVNQAIVIHFDKDLIDTAVQGI